jgi:hypothetical protein
VCGVRGRRWLSGSAGDGNANALVCWSNQVCMRSSRDDGADAAFAVFGWSHPDPSRTKPGPNGWFEVLLTSPPDPGETSTKADAQSCSRQQKLTSKVRDNVSALMRKTRAHLELKSESGTLIVEKTWQQCCSLLAQCSISQAARRFPSSFR